MAGGGGALDESPATNVGYVSVIRRALDHTMLADPPSGDLEETGSQLATPRMSADSSGRTSTGSVSTVLCAEDEEDMMCQSENEEPDEKEQIIESSSSPGYKSSMEITRSSNAECSTSVQALSSPSFSAVSANASEFSSRSEVIVKIESSS